MIEDLLLTVRMLIENSKQKMPLKYANQSFIFTFLPLV